MMRLARKDTATVFKWEQGVTETKETEAGEIIAAKQICSKKLLKETSTWCSYTDTLLCPHYVNGFSCSDGPTITSPRPAHPRQCAQLVTPVVRRWFPAEAGETPAKQKLNLEWENDENDPSGDQSKPSLTPTELAGHPFFKRALKFAQSWPPLSLDPRTKSGKT